MSGPIRCDVHPHITHGPEGCQECYREFVHIPVKSNRPTWTREQLQTWGLEPGASIGADLIAAYDALAKIATHANSPGDCNGVYEANIAAEALPEGWRLP